MAEFLAGASGWYDHELQKSLSQQTASALRLTIFVYRDRLLNRFARPVPTWQFYTARPEMSPASGVA